MFRDVPECSIFLVLLTVFQFSFFIPVPRLRIAGFFKLSKIAERIEWHSQQSRVKIEKKKENKTRQKCVKQDLCVQFEITN